MGKPVVMCKSVVNEEPKPQCTGNSHGVVYSPGSTLKALFTPSNKRITYYCTQSLNIIFKLQQSRTFKKISRNIRRILTCQNAVPFLSKEEPLSLLKCNSCHCRNPVQKMK